METKLCRGVNENKRTVTTLLHLAIGDEIWPLFIIFLFYWPHPGVTKICHD